MSTLPAWIKRSENGSLGEARARALLLERFWLLERSIDKDGADYLIQRRLTADNFLSRDPPRLGVVQVKYIQDEGTSIYIKPEYVTDPDGKPYGEFYLLVHSGTEDAQRQFLLSGKQIIDDFKISTSKSGDSNYYIPGKQILSGSRYEILSKKTALDRIEHSLKNANFLRNRFHFGASEYVKIEKDHIDSDYILPIQNGYCDFDREFFKQKKEMQSTLFNLEEVVEAIGKILRCTDPIEAYEIYQNSIEEYVGGYGWRSSLSFGADFFGDEDFIAAAKNHKARLGKIRELGLENSYIRLLDEYEAAVLGKIVKDTLWECEDELSVSAEYDPSTLQSLTVQLNKPTASKKESYPIVLKSELGKNKIVFLPRQLNNRWKGDDGKDALEVVRNNSWQIRRAFQKELDRHLLGEDLESPWL